MVSTYHSRLNTKEDLMAFIKYSIPLFERKKEDEEEKDELSDLLEEDKMEDNTSKNVVYVDNYQQERLSSNYSSTIGTYLDRRQDALHDFTDRVPGKHMESFPISGNEGLYGFTFLGDQKVWRRDDLTGNFAKMVDIHECIHTPNEYETRILTSWIMAKQPVKYIK
jgi:hypothetical protein|tara:strand:- start:514 stop:1011 length:498 start_codon:yes stop_codon:yes gene_type:complete